MADIEKAIERIHSLLDKGYGCSRHSHYCEKGKDKLFDPNNCNRCKVDQALSALAEPVCEKCGGSGEVDDVVHSVNAGMDINKPCPDCWDLKKPPEVTIERIKPVLKNFGKKKQLSVCPQPSESEFVKTCRDKYCMPCTLDEECGEDFNKALCLLDAQQLAIKYLYHCAVSGEDLPLTRKVVNETLKRILGDEFEELTDEQK